jgi:hypothetical protein
MAFSATIKDWMNDVVARLKNRGEDLWQIELVDDGLVVNKNGRFDSEARWVNIDKIFAYKRDLLTYDSIFLAFLCGDVLITVDESFDGFSDLMVRLNEVFPGTDENWYVDMSTQPAFEEMSAIFWERPSS